MSISTLRQLLESYVKEKGWNIGEVYVDDGFSGTTFERPDFQRVVSDIQKGKINIVITKDLAASERTEIMMDVLLEKNPAPDKVKEQMQWVARMNSSKVYGRGGNP